VRRPVRSIISWRRAGSRSTRTFSMSATPFAFSRRSAIRQNGHTPVEYISTFAMSLLLHRQARLLPSRDAALELVDAGEARLAQQARGGAGARAGLPSDDDGLVLELHDLAHPLRELRQR